MSPACIAVWGLWAIVTAQPPRAPARTTHPSAAVRPANRATPSASQRRGSPASSGQQLLENLSLVKGNNTPEARRLGAARLIEIGSPEAVSRLAEVLQSRPGDVAAQIAVCEAIADANRPNQALIAPLLALLSDKRPGLKDAALYGLQRFDGGELVRQLRAMAENLSLDIERRLSAINALGALGDNLSAVHALADLLKEGGHTIQTSAFAAIRQATGADLTDAEEALKWWNEHRDTPERDWLRRRNEIRAAEAHRKSVEIGTLTARLSAAYRDAYHKDPDSERPGRLLALLNDPTPGIRLLGLDLVNDLITDRKDVPTEVHDRLIESLFDPTAQVRAQSARIVGDLRLAGAFEPLAQALTLEEDPSVRKAQVNAIGRLEAPRLLHVLVERLDDDAASVAGEAALALGRAGRRSDRPADGSPDDRPDIAVLLIDRCGRLQPEQAQLREQILAAMAMIGDGRFRPVFEAEVSANGDLRARRSAIAGLAGYGDVEAAEVVRRCLKDTEAEIRLAAADGLAKCGRGRIDLAALADHIDPAGESSPAVRQQAWDAYLRIAAQLPAEERLKISDEFNRPVDRVAQRRRLDLVKPLAGDVRVSGGQPVKNGGGNFDPLPKSRRIDVLERIADAQWNLGDFSASASSLDQALEVMKDGNGRAASLAARAVAARLKAREDALAVERAKELMDALRATPSAAPALLNTIFDEIRSRTDSAADAAAFANVLLLIESIGPLVNQAGERWEQSLKAITFAAIAKRSAALDRLFAALPDDADSEQKLIAYPRDVVLAGLVDALRAASSATQPIGDTDDRLVEWAKRLSPGWAGFPRDATPEQRAAALDQLLKTPAAKPPNGASAARRPEGSSPINALAPRGE